MKLFRYAGRMFKVAKPVAGGSEPPPLPPTTVVADFKRRRQENEAERCGFKKLLALILTSPNTFLV